MTGAPKTIGVVGASLFWIVLWVLVSPAGMFVADGILLAILLVGVPTLAIAQVPLVEHDRVERMPAYTGSILALWLLAGASYLVGTRGGASLGLALPPSPSGLVAWSVGLTLAGFAIILCFREIAIRMEVDESPVLRELLPRTRQERTAFFALSVAAGVGEELAYRAYAIPLLAPFLGLGGSVALTSIVFGVVHAYQGALGMVRTGLMGAVLAWGFLAAGSIWPAIIAHTLIDVAAGLVFAERLLPPPRAEGVVGAPGRFPDKSR